MNWGHSLSGFGGVLIGAFLVGAGIKAADPVDEVRARKFVLVDSNDREVGVWESGQDGARFRLIGSPGSAGGGLATLSADDKIANLHLVGDDHSSLDLTSGDVFGSTMIVNDQDGKPRYSLSASGRGKPVLNLRDRNDQEFDAFAGLHPPLGSNYEIQR